MRRNPWQIGGLNPEGTVTDMPHVALAAHWDWVLYHFRMPIAHALRNAGCDVTLVSPSGPHIVDFRREGFDWREWDVERRSMNPAREARSLASLVRTYRQERFDAVHHFTVKPCLYGTLAARIASIPVVLNMFSGLGFVFSDDATASRLRAVLMPVMRRAFDRQGVWVLALNEPDMGSLRESGLASPERSRLMPEGVDLARFTVEDRGDGDGSEPAAVLACRLLRDKGVAEFVEAARLLAQRGVPIRMQVAGEPDLGNPASVTQDELADWELQTPVEFLGKRTDMDVVLEQADIAVLPTHYKEGLPRFLLEGAASGLALVATDIPGCRDIVRDGDNGFLIPVRDSGRLADALEELARDHQLRERFGRRAREIVEDEFSMCKVVEEHLRLYRDVGVLS